MPSRLSSAATAMMDGQFAGCPTGEITPGRSLSLPAAAMMMVPALSAARHLLENPRVALADHRRRTEDMEMIRHFWLMAQLMPARMPASPPLPALLNTLPT